MANYSAMPDDLPETSGASKSKSNIGGASEFINTLNQLQGSLPKLPSAIGGASAEREAQVKNVRSQEKILEDVNKYTNSGQPPPLDSSKLKPLPEPSKEEFKPPTDAFKEIMPIFAIFASMATRHPLKTAMMSAAAAMEAFHKGDAENIELHRQNVKDQMDYALAYNKNAVEIQNAIWNDRNSTIAEKIAKSNAYAHINEQWDLIAAHKEGDAAKVYEMQKDRFDMTMKAADAYEKWNKTLQMQNGIISDEAAEFVTEQILAGDTKGLTNYGRGAQGSQNLTKIRETVARVAKERGISGAQLAAIDAKFAGLQAQARAEGSRAGAIEISSAAVNGAAQMALESSEKFDRGQFPKLNDIYQAFSKGTGDPEIVDFAVKNNTLINEYAAAQNPRGIPRISDKEHARELLETAFNKGQYEAGVKAILAEVANIKKATGDVMSGKESGGDRIRVLDPEGQPHTIDASELDEAIAHGWKKR